MGSKIPQPVAVAVCIDTRDGAGRRRLHGVAQYGQRNGWRMMLVRQSGRDAAQEVLGLRPHGIITYIAEGSLVEAALQMAVPLVDTARSDVDVESFVSLNNEEVGRLAAERLAGLGLRSFGYVGVRGKRVSVDRQACFARHLKPRGFVPAAFSQRIAEGESRIRPLIRWLESLPKPVGVLSFDDKLAERVLTACRWAGLSVPNSVAVLGIGNDDLVSKLTWPSLSSINVPAERMGFEAAEILDQMIHGKAIDEPKRWLAPSGVTMRGSTALLAVQDSVVESAARYVREHAGDAIGVGHVARAVGVSRRTLDRRFTEALGRSVHEELTTVRMQHACELLSEGLETVGAIAKACGFGSASSFSRAFHRHLGCWPIEYRNQFRG